MFRNNQAINYGGAVILDGIGASLSLVANVTFQSNSARGGGAISSGSVALLNVTNSTFSNNRQVFDQMTCF